MGFQKISRPEVEGGAHGATVSPMSVAPVWPRPSTSGLDKKSCGLACFNFCRAEDFAHGPTQLGDFVRLRDRCGKTVLPALAHDGVAVVTARNNRLNLRADAAQPTDCLAAAHVAGK